MWSVGEFCQARWSGDGKLYTGIVKKLKHIETGRVVALVKFSDYDSEDSEEVDVQLLQKLVKVKNQENSTVGLEQPGVGAVFSQVCLYDCMAVLINSCCRIQ